MAITITKENYPALANGTGISGKRVVLYLNYGSSATAEAPVWSLIGGLKSHTLSISAEVNTQQTKESGYWAKGALISKSAELSAEVVMERDDAGQEAIEAFMMDDDITAAKNALMFAIVDLDTKDYVQLWAIPTSWEISADGEDMVMKSLSATVVGTPEKKTAFSAS